MDKGKRLAETIGRGGAPLQEDSFRTDVVQLVEAFQITCLEREVAVIGRTEGHRDVGGLVAFDAKPRANDVDRQRGIGADDENQDRR
jgi:hypothetical protein